MDGSYLWWCCIFVLKLGARATEFQTLAKALLLLVSFYHTQWEDICRHCYMFEFV